MNRYLFILCFSLIPFSLFSQGLNYSSLYLNNGKLRTDSSLAISAEQFKIWWRAEPNIMAAVAADLKYPPVAIRNAIEGKALVAFEFTGKEIKNIRTVNASPQLLKDAAINAVQTSGKIIIEELLYFQRRTEAKGTYYIPIDFELIDTRAEVKKRGSIPVIESSSLPSHHREHLDGLKQGK